ncbi:MAG: hypothetical protein ABFS17_13450 [Chloroflexota bacterium]
MDQPTFHQRLKSQGRSEKLASWDPAELHVVLKIFVERTNFEGIPPQPAEVLYSVTTAQNLPQIVEHS